MKRIAFKKYAGVKIKGTVPMPKLSPDSSHIHRAEWLTAMVESNGNFGSVMNYDGTGMTAGIHQAIAVYPKQMLHADGIAVNDQGPLWKLLRRMEMVCNGALWFDFSSKLLKTGWILSPDGKLRHWDTGRPVSGREIRLEFTGSADGVMPLKGPDRKRAEFWARDFSELFSDPSTFKVQQEYGLEHFVKRAERTKLRFSQTYSNLTIQEAVYGDTSISTIKPLEMGPELDLAMSMFWSNTVNAPGAALKKLCRVARSICGPGGNAPNFSRALIKKLGNTSFGRWDDDIENGRYQRTRRYAMKLWPKELFTGPGAFMPKNFPG